MTISSEQIRAARGLLNLSQKALAEQAGLSLNSLNNIERGVAHPREESLEAIEKALTGLGIEFLDGHGVRLRGEKFNVKVIEGTSLLRRLYREILKRLPTGPGEVLYMGIDNARFGHLETDKLFAYQEMEQELINRNIGERLLFQDGDTGFLSRRNVYRWIPKELFATVPMVIFADRVAIVLWGPPQRIVIIQNESIAETFRTQFEALWSLGKPVPDAIHEFHRIKNEDGKDRGDTGKDS